MRVRVFPKLKIFFAYLNSGLDRDLEPLRQGDGIGIPALSDLVVKPEKPFECHL